jgi:hypothetical protein
VFVRGVYLWLVLVAVTTATCANLALPNTTAHPAEAPAVCPGIPAIPCGLLLLTENLKPQ